MTENGGWGIKNPQLYARVSKQRQRGPRSLGITSTEPLAEDTGSSEMEGESQSLGVSNGHHLGRRQNQGRETCILTVLYISTKFYMNSYTSYET